jgi:hypothetical protein
MSREEPVTTLATIFSDFRLPTAATWFYFSLLLAVALFFKFSRLLSMRNWDVLTIFLLVPGLLLLQEAHTQMAAQAAGSFGYVAQEISSPLAGLSGTGALAAMVEPVRPGPLMWFGYLSLLGGTAYFLVRCFIDLALVRRPSLSPNLNPGGLAWLGSALFVCLVSVAVRQQERPPEPVGKASLTLKEAERGLTDLVNQQTAAGETAGFDTRFWVNCSLAILCHLAVVVGLVVAGYRHFQDFHAGMAAATFYLLLPYTAYHVGQVHHVWPVALLVWAVVFYRLPMLAGCLLGLAAGSAYFPALVFPVWLSFYWNRGAGRFTAAFIASALLSLAVAVGILFAQGELSNTVKSTLALADWQAWKVPTTESFWTGVHWAYRLPVFIAYLAFVFTTAFWPAPKNLAHVLALSAAVLIGIQFWYANQGGVYVLWYLPLLLLLIFRPNLTDRIPPPIDSETDWLARLGRFLGRQINRLLRFPQPMARVH